MPLDMLITGRIATLAGDAGFGWVEAVGIRDGRIAFAGSEVALETRADPFTERIALEPDEVAIPGLTDAHLHLAGAADATRQIDLSDAPTLTEGLARIGAAHAAAGDPDAWLEGHGWDVDRWGRWPTADDLETVAPGRRAAFWAHDHHALLASRAALATAGLDATTEDPSGGLIRRDEHGAPEGVLYEAATRLVTRHIPPITGLELEGRIVAVSLALLALGVVAAHDPGRLSPDPELDWSYPAYAHLSELERLPVRVLASLRDDALETALAGGLRSGAILGANPRGRARIGWQKCFADGSLGSRTAALLADIEPEPDRPLAPERRRGVWITEPDELRERVERAAAGGIATQIHGIGDAAVRAALDALEPIGRERAVHAQGGACPAAGPGRPRPLRRRRDRGERPALAPGQRCPTGPTAVGRSGRAERLRVGVDRRDRRRPGLRDGRARRSRSIRGPGSRSRSVARIPAGRPARRRSRPARR